VPVDALQDTGLQGVKVLFIDDEEPVRRAMRHVLRRFGCDAVEAAGSDEALERTRGFVPELVLADCRLGGGDNGITAVARLRERWPALPAVLISGDTDAERLLEAERSGLPLLHKPVTLERLREAMTSALGARQTGGLRSPADAAAPTGPAPPSLPCAH
jgi:CheY-like chemotaxis protein